MPQIMEQRCTKKRKNPLWAKPGIRPLFSKADKEPFSQMVYAYGMACPGMGGPWIKVKGRAQLHNPVKPHKGQRSRQSPQTRGKINMPPQNIPNGITISGPKAGKDTFLHSIIV